jgi:leucyl aminopeptidase
MQLSIGKTFETTVYFVSSEDKLDHLAKDLAEYALNTLEFKGELNEKVINLGPNTENSVVIGLGAANDLTRDHYVKAAHTAATVLENHKVNEVSVQISTYNTVNEEITLQAIAEGFLQAAYSFDDYRSEKPEKSLKEVSLLSDFASAEDALNEIITVLDAVNFTRDLVNTPANDLYPETLVEKVEKAFSETDVAMEVFDKEALSELGAEALLAVSKGSDKEPRMLVLKYLPLGEDEPAVSLVGKGVTYDSGGYAIKNAKGMATMMTDMAGAAAMIGTLQALAENKVQQNVIAVIGATENLISGSAFKNGDIINSLKGSTIEVLNTDAEGRLVLADALYYAATELNSKYIIDAATLTGAVIAALGANTTGVMTNNQKLFEKVEEASKNVGEKMWQLPITEEFREAVKGNNADLTNVPPNPAGAGSIFAAAFLEEFVEDVPWVHLDIAGTSYSRSKGDKYLPKGASGIPVKTLYEFVKNL